MKFGRFILSFYPNVLIIKDSKTNQENIFDESTLGFKLVDPIIKQGFTSKTYSYFYIYTKNKFYELIFYFPEEEFGGFSLDVNNIPLPFDFNRYVKIFTGNHSVILVDNKHFFLYSNELSFKDEIKLMIPFEVKLVDKYTFLAWDTKRLFIFHKGKRAEILFDSLNISNPKFKHIEKKRNYLILSFTQNVIYVSLSKKNFGYYGIKNEFRLFDALMEKSTHSSSSSSHSKSSSSSSSSSQSNSSSSSSSMQSPKR